MKGPFASLLLTLVALTAGVSHAADPVAPPATPATVEGELHVTLKNAEYVKVQVNGQDYENIEFEKDGKVVLIKGLSLSLDHNAITLLPTDASLKQLDVEVVAKDFKKKRKGREVYLVATKTVGFEKASTDAPPAPDKPKTDPVAPPPPQKDDL